MGYLLDTDVIIDYLKNREPGLSIFNKIPHNHLTISIISWIEIYYGTKKSLQPEKRTKEFIAFLNDFSIEVLSVEEKVALQFVSLKIQLENKRIPLADFDLLIAATALVYQCQLATGNTKHFSRIRNINLYRSYS